MVIRDHGKNSTKEPVGYSLLFRVYAVMRPSRSFPRGRLDNDMGNRRSVSLGSWQVPPDRWHLKFCLTLQSLTISEVSAMREVEALWLSRRGLQKDL